MKNPYIAVENEFDIALATLSIVQTIFTQEQDAPPKDEYIFWALEGVRKDINRIKYKLLEMA